jgi:hypothetical protein
MSRDGKVTFDWGDGTYTFRLGLGEVEELQEKTDCGPYFLLQRINGGTWKVHDLRETIRLGLIGGGTEPGKALSLVKRYFDARPMLEGIAPARAILTAALVGAPDGEKPGKRSAARAKTSPPNSPTDGSPLPDTTGQEPS